MSGADGRIASVRENGGGAGETAGFSAPFWRAPGHPSAMRPWLSSECLRCLPGLLLPLAALCAPVPARAAVAWTATFENGDLSEWMPGINPTKGDRKNVEVLGEKV